MSEVIVGIVGLFVLLLLFTTGIELGFAMAAVASWASATLSPSIRGLVWWVEIYGTCFLLWVYCIPSFHSHGADRL